MVWKPLEDEIKIKPLIETQEDYNNDGRGTKDGRMLKTMCCEEPLWVTTQWTVIQVDALKAALSKRNWNLSISEV